MLRLFKHILSLSDFLFPWLYFSNITRCAGKGYSSHDFVAVMGKERASDSYNFLWILAETCSEILFVYPAFVLIFSTAVLDPDLCPWCRSSSIGIYTSFLLAISRSSSAFTLCPLLVDIWTSVCPAHCGPTIVKHRF